MRSLDTAGLIVEGFSDRETWLRARRDPTAIGASEAAMALGISPYGTEWELYARKIDRRGDEAADAEYTEDRMSAALTRGNRWESAALAEYEDASGNTVLTPGDLVGLPSAKLVTIARRETPWLRQSPDGGAISRGELGHVEAKTAMRPAVWAPEQGLVIDSWRDEYAELIPAHYAVQAYVQLYVTGLAWNDVLALVPQRGWLGVRWVRLMRDDATQSAIVEQLAEWREKHLVRREPPEIDASQACNQSLALHFPKIEGKGKRPERPATADERDMILAYAQLSFEEKRIEATKAALRNRLIDAAKGERLLVDASDPARKGHRFAQPQVSGGRTTVDMGLLRNKLGNDVVKPFERVGSPSCSFVLYGFDNKEGT